MDKKMKTIYGKPVIDVYLARKIAKKIDDIREFKGYYSTEDCSREYKRREYLEVSLKKRRIKFKFYGIGNEQGYDKNGSIYGEMDIGRAPEDWPDKAEELALSESMIRGLACQSIDNIYAKIIITVSRWGNHNYLAMITESGEIWSYAKKA